MVDANTGIKPFTSTTLDVFNKGQECLLKFEKDKGLTGDQRKAQLDRAEEIFNALLNDRRECHVLAFMLATIHTKRGNLGFARILLREALRLRPDFLDAMNNLGFVNKLDNMVEESRSIFENVIKLVEEQPQLLEKYKLTDTDKGNYILNLGSTYIAVGNPKKAHEIFTESLKLIPDCDMAKWNRSLANLEMGNYAEGWDEYDHGDRVLNTVDRKYGAMSTPFWDGTKGQTVVVYGEQGLGDEIMFASMLPDLMKDCNVVFDCHPRLQRMFQYNYPEIPIYGTRKVATPKPDSLPWSMYHKIDAKLSIGTLGKYYRRNLEDFPGTAFLDAEPELIRKYREKLKAMGPRKKVGISWRGGVVSTNKATRKIKLEQLLPLFGCDVDFISLQYDKDIGPHVKKFEDKHGIKLNHWQEVLNDYDETAGLVANLDLIISVPQSVVHLAGALGKPTIQLCPIRALWQMGPYGENMPWYSMTENIWQEKDGDWTPVIAKAKEKLCNLFQNNIQN